MRFDVHVHVERQGEVIALLEKILHAVNGVKETGEEIMSAVADFAAKQNSFNDRIDAAVTGIQGDVKFLSDTIAKLQTSAGTVTPEDQALLDALEARAATITAKVEALDAMTPPVPPTA